MRDFESDGQADDDEDEVGGDIEITFEPNLERFRELGIGFDDFQDALMAALEAREAAVDAGDDDFDLPPLEDMILQINGTPHRLEDLADVEIKERDPADDE